MQPLGCIEVRMDTIKGGILDRTCLSCGNLAESNARFCNNCGASLGPEAGAASSTASTQISPQDAQEIVAEVQALYASIPVLVRPMVPPLPQILRQIPACARKYTLQQLIELLEEAHAQGLI